MSLRVRLLAAFAYVLILVIVALEVPLILNVSRRVDTEVKARAAADAQLVAASAAAELDTRDIRDLRQIVRRAAEDAGGRVLVVDRRGTVVADSAGQTGNYGDRPEIQGALDGGIEQGAGSATHSVRRCSSRPCQSWSRAAPSAAPSASRRASTPSTGGCGATCSD